MGSTILLSVSNICKPTRSAIWAESYPPIGTLKLSKPVFTHVDTLFLSRVFLHANIFCYCSSVIST